MALNDSTRQTEFRFPIVVPQMTIQSMRSSGYKSTTHALAELIDNSIESGADMIEIFGLSRTDETTGRQTLHELAVLDNGAGMDAPMLQGSLCYGHGTRGDRRGIGRFGMGLPNSSMSQARCLDVWSWQSGVTNALHTRLHLDDVDQGLSEIPVPQIRPLPNAYLDASQNAFGDSGTLVLWRELDRVEWRRASTTFKHTENLLGRIYRRFLAKESERLHPQDDRGEEIGPRRTILLVPVDAQSHGIEVAYDDIVEVRPNDPLYLMTGTSCPEDFGAGPMFKELEGFSPFSLPIYHDGKSHSVRVRASHARPTARNPSAPEATWPDRYTSRDAGNAPWGRHAAQNLGISIMRAHREIHLDTTWTSPSEPTDRWWTIEVDFPTELDDLFGVTYTKQGAPTFPRLADFDWKREALDDDESRTDVLRRMEETGDPRASLLDLQQQIVRCRRSLRARAGDAKKERGPRHEDTGEESKADKQASGAIKRRVENEGREGTSDKKAKTGTPEEHKQEQLDSLDKRHIDPEVALEIVDETIRTGNRVRWIQSELASPAFFDVEPLPNVVQVVFNKQHPVHSHFWEVMHPDADNENLSAEDLAERLERAAMAFRVLIYSWARYEEEQTDKDLRRVRNARIEWGKYAEDFFDNDDDSPPPTDLV